MKCPACSSDESKVLESREVSEGESIRRRRECLACNARFTTYERIERPNLVVIKKDGTRELFDRVKLQVGLSHAAEKRPVSQLQIEELVSRIERRLYEGDSAEVSSTMIGEYVMENLARLDEVAYLRFASVYRDFDTLADFDEELKQLRKK